MKIIIHCSASNFGNSSLITKWHVVERGWKDIGYHFVILNGQIGANKSYKEFDGHIETGRPIDDDKWFEPDEIGAHTLGNNNCVGICLIGNSNTFTKKQFDSLNKLLKMLKKQFGSIEVFQHSDFDPINKPWCAGITKDKMDELKKV